MIHKFVISSVIVLLSACSLMSNPEETAIVRVQGDRTISCRIGADCDARWARVTAWVAANVTFAPVTTTPTLIVTGHPGLFGSKPGVTVSQSAAGYSYESINFAASCGFLVPRCDPDLDQMKASFIAYVTAP